MAEAKAAGFTYDTTDEYNTFKETIKTSAASAGDLIRNMYVPSTEAMQPWAVSKNM